MLEHSWLGDALRAGGALIFIMYWGAALGLAYFVWDWFKQPLIAPGLIVIALAFGYLPFAIYQERKARDEYVTAAWAHFNKLCKEKAGIKVYKTVKGVESVLLTRPRPTVSADERELFDQFWRGDQYGGISIGANPGSLLIVQLGRFDDVIDAALGKTQTRPGYKFIELSIGQRNGVPVTTRYTVDVSRGVAVEIKPTYSTPASRYVIEWNDDSSVEDQKYWVSASNWTIRDGQSGELLGQRFGYVIEPGFGSKAGARRPWLMALNEQTSCPKLSKNALGPYNRQFVEQILQPQLGE